MQNITSRKYNTSRQVGGEVVFNNFVDKDIQSMLLPLNIMQSIFFCPKYLIKDNFITSLDRRRALYSACGTALCLLVSSYRAYDLWLLNRMNVSESNFFPISIAFEYTLSSIGFILNFVLNWLCIDTNVAFVLRVQDVHRALDDRAALASLAAGNWASVAATFAFHALVLLAGYFYISTPLHYVLSTFLLVSFDANLVYGIRLAKLLKTETTLWSAEAMNTTMNKTFKNAKKLRGKLLFECYINILDCFKLFKRNYKYLVLYHIIAGFGYAILHVKMWIDYFKLSIVEIDLQNNMESTVRFISILIYLAKNLVLQSTLSLYCEAFYVAVSDAQDICALSRVCGASREKKMVCSKMVRVYRSGFRKLSASGAFAVDAALPLRLVRLLTNYTIVMLQLAFL